MEKPCKCRYDAAGRKILPHPAMLLYYKDDKQSLDLVRRFMPYRLMVIPAVEIHIHPTTPPAVYLYLIYPGETIERTIDASVRSLEGLRRTYRGRKGWTSRKSTSGAVVLRREGRVILDPKKRFGVLA